MRKKLLAVVAGVLAFFLIIGGFKVYMDTQIAANAPGLRNHRTYERFWSSAAQSNIMDGQTLPVFGSSELRALSKYENGVGSFLNGEEMNIMPIGAGYFQSLSHVMALGAISDRIQSGKVALFLSPQWFEPNGVRAEAFASRLSEDNLLQFLCNSKISRENKQYVVNRAVSLLSDSPTQQQRVIHYAKAVENPISVDFLYTRVMAGFWEYRAEYEVYKILDEVGQELPHYDLSELDFDGILALAEQQGIAACTNNEFGIYDEYFDTYVKPTYEAGEVAEKQQKFTESVEYTDLRCFLDVAAELGVEVILVSIPVNEKWYAYTGVLCDQYYKNIRQIAGEYDNIRFVDMSVYASEPYFLKDIMHLGWKGWARVNEALYTEFTKQ